MKLFPLHIVVVLSGFADHVNPHLLNVQVCWVTIKRVCGSFQA